MGRVSGRDAEQTRRQVLDAAARLIGAKGLGASLEEIARTAGVSKGGLKYHFASKEELLDELAADLVQSFRDEVDSFVVPDDTDPGRVARGYIRCVLQPGTDAATTIARHGLMAQLITVQSVRDIWREDAAWWGQTMAEDGLEPTLADMVLTSADGAASSALWGDEFTFERLTALRERLLEMTREGH